LTRPTHIPLFNCFLSRHFVRNPPFPLPHVRNDVIDQCFVLAHGIALAAARIQMVLHKGMETLNAAPLNSRRHDVPNNEIDQGYVFVDGDCCL
jgi:hypothetical protein